MGRWKIRKISTNMLSSEVMEIWTFKPTRDAFHQVFFLGVEYQFKTGLKIRDVHQSHIGSNRSKIFQQLIRVLRAIFSSQSEIFKLPRNQRGDFILRCHARVSYQHSCLALWNSRTPVNSWLFRLPKKQISLSLCLCSGFQVLQRWETNSHSISTVVRKTRRCHLGMICNWEEGR